MYLKFIIKVMNIMSNTNCFMLIKRYLYRSLGCFRSSERRTQNCPFHRAPFKRKRLFSSPWSFYTQRKPQIAAACFISRSVSIAGVLNTIHLISISFLASEKTITTWQLLIVFYANVNKNRKYSKMIGCRARESKTTLSKVE